MLSYSLEKFANNKFIFAVYLSCALLVSLVLLAKNNRNLEQKFLHPLDKSYSILGSRSVFRDYLGEEKVYAFLPYWSLRDGNLNVSHLTDVSYFGLTVDYKGRIVTTDGPYKKWREDRNLANVVKKVKESGGRVSITLVCHKDEDIDAILNCRDCWTDLAKDVIRELAWAKITDVNVDFEYSGYTTYENAQKYSQLVGLLNSKLDKVFGDSFVVVSASADSADRVERTKYVPKGFGKDIKTTYGVRITDPKSLAENADAIFIMAYDFHRPASAVAGPVSPLDGSYTTTNLNLTKTLESYLKVVPASKLILGLPFYGYDWIVESPDPMSTRIEGNETIGFSRSRTYAEVVDLLVKKQITTLWHDPSKTPYFNYKDLETGVLRQVWYDDEKSLKTKVDLARQNNLLGVGAWALGFEGGYVDIWKAFNLDK